MRKVLLLAAVLGVSFVAGVKWQQVHAQAATVLNVITLDYTNNNGNIAVVTLTGTRSGVSRTITLDLVAKTCTATATQFCGGAASSTLSTAQLSRLSALLPADQKMALGKAILQIIQADDVQ